MTKVTNHSGFLKSQVCRADDCCDFASRRCAWGKARDALARTRKRHVKRSTDPLKRSLAAHYTCVYPSPLYIFICLNVQDGSPAAESVQAGHAAARRLCEAPRLSCWRVSVAANNNALSISCSRSAVPLLCLTTYCVTPSSCFFASQLSQAVSGKGPRWCCSAGRRARHCHIWYDQVL